MGRAPAATGTGVVGYNISAAAYTGGLPPLRPVVSVSALGDATCGVPHAAESSRKVLTRARKPGLQEAVTLEVKLAFQSHDELDGDLYVEKAEEQLGGAVDEWDLLAQRALDANGMEIDFDNMPDSISFPIEMRLTFQKIKLRDADTLEDESAEANTEAEEATDETSRDEAASEDEGDSFDSAEEEEEEEAIDTLVDAEAEERNHVPPANEEIESEVFEVVGGSTTGGIVVRAGRDMSSPQNSQRLATGARVCALKHEAGRVFFRKLSGSGPESGWVSLRYKGAYLLVPMGDESNALYEDALSERSFSLPSAPVPAKSNAEACLRAGQSNGSVWKVVGGAARGGIIVRSGWLTTSSVFPELLTKGSIVKGLDYDAGRLHYELISGAGPSSGWVNTAYRGKSLVARIATVPKPQVDSALLVDSARACEETVGQDDEDWFTALSEPSPDSLDQDNYLCWCFGCGLPINGLLLRCQCTFPVLLHDVEEKDAQARQRAEWEHKWRLRAKYGIGWQEDCVPNNACLAAKLGVDLRRGEKCCLVAQGPTRSVQLRSTSDARASINLGYFSEALKSIRTDGRQPWSSLDPKEPSDPKSMLKKNFQPAWLAGTSVGEVLFQADYYLKELAMGQFEQPIPGMKSCLDFAQADGNYEDWSARIWFVYKDVAVKVSDNDVLLPCVTLGVEAREQILGTNDDAPSTRPDHPLKKYADLFTANFDAILERSAAAEEGDPLRAITSLHEVAKASLLAEFLAQDGFDLADTWFELVEEPPFSCSVEVPQLWNYSQGDSASRLGAHSPTRMLVGGVDLSLQAFKAQIAKPELEVESKPKPRRMRPRSLQDPARTQRAGMTLLTDLEEPAELRPAERGRAMASLSGPIGRRRVIDQDGAFRAWLAARAAATGTSAADAAFPWRITGRPGMVSAGEEATQPAGAGGPSSILFSYLFAHEPEIPLASLLPTDLVQLFPDMGARNPAPARQRERRTKRK